MGVVLSLADSRHGCSPSLEKVEGGGGHSKTNSWSSAAENGVVWEQQVVPSTPATAGTVEPQEHGVLHQKQQNIYKDV